MSSHRRVRRLACVAITAATMTLATACGTSSAAGEKYTGTVHVGVFPSFNANSAYAADAADAFEDKGLDVEFTTIATPADAAPQLIGGKLQFALMDMTTPIVAASQGTKFTMVAPGATGTPVESDGWGSANIWVTPGSGIDDVKDLTGRKVGVPALNSQIWLDVRTTIDEAGGDSSKVDWVETGRAGVDQVKAGSIDATTTAEPSGTALADDPKIEHLAGYTSASGNLSYSFVATEQFAKANAELVSKFEAAVLEGNKAFNGYDVKKKAEIAHLAIPDAPLPLLEASRYPVYREEPIDVGSVEAAIERLEKYGMLEGGKAPAAASFLPAE